MAYRSREQSLTCPNVCYEWMEEEKKEGKIFCKWKQGNKWKQDSGEFCSTRFDKNYNLIALRCESNRILLWLCGKTVLETQLVAPPAFWTTTFMRKSCWIFDAAGGNDGCLVCLLICDSVGPAAGGAAATLPPAGHPKDWDKENCLCLVNFVLKAETLRPSFFSRGYETEQPAAPPTPCTTPPPSCCDTIRRRLKEPPRCEDLQPGHIRAPETQIGALNHVTSCWAFHVCAGQREPLMKGASVKGRLMRLASLLAWGDVRQRRGYNIWRVPLTSFVSPSFWKYLEAFYLFVLN